MSENIQSNDQLYPVVTIRDGIVFPSAENVLVFGRDKSVLAMKQAMKEEKKVVLVMQKKVDLDDPKTSDLYDIGVVAQIDKIATGDKGQINALVKGLYKVHIDSYTQTEPYFSASVSEILESSQETEEILAVVKYISGQVKKAINLGKTIDFVFLMNILNIQSSHNFSNQVAMIVDIKTAERQQLLEETDLLKRLQNEVEYINKEIKVLELEHNISNKTHKKFEKNMRETFLREKMKTIEEELGDKGDNVEVNEYKKKIKDAAMPEDVQKKAVKELKRLTQMSQYNPEASYIRSYLDWLVEIPWEVASKQNIDIKLAQKILDEDHFGLKKVKERIIEFLAVMKLKDIQDEEEKAAQKKKPEDKRPSKKHETQPSILCFVGPPGVGKTSLGKSIARAQGKEFVKISLGGIRDEAEIRGHRRTYVGALPGRMIQGIKQAGTNNPVFMLDEIDKIGSDYRGDPSAALLEALDPEQNHAFSDHYLEVPFDMSDVFFITTANVLDTIPDALRDRLEIIHFVGYTEEEKFNIAKNYLIPKQVRAHYIPEKRISITDGALQTVIRRYSREAGVRELERQIATVLRKVARDIVEGKIKGKGKAIGQTDVQKYLGQYKYSDSLIEEKDSVGITTGLAWTQVGGVILFVEVANMPGKGSLTLTGNLGDVMKESCQAALTYIRARWDMFKLEEKFYMDMDIHVHVPEGAVPKDGPSAGVSIVTSMISSLTGIPVKHDVAMTGEITLRGRVTEIGGLKEKIIAAHRAKIKTVIIPEENKKDLVDIPDKVKKDLNFVFAKHIDDVIQAALTFPTKKKVFEDRRRHLTLKKEKIN
ncbi:endopeptidase La [Candidatus Roizmanbacteria bacterium CG_4_9_14_0_2_um_filter_39_13]|uniref:Lon protease n=2 Tax=Candidatus Roizmaniibacteriota TaxID=1752723 RepID=A0A2M8EWZ0_9BACT|nr:MAG: endopeptidase La [Candidatus Roizmanbacteria bacterium CG_4_10_14_0_2_um_filter_39_12]PJC30380.1 MAG: endopeptidase La [Candidatus Roizmanbacteria bacterium CG_4_9_14_0_2_um_filter_39_13]PJE61347.1 MAG: endopeptidase La [Candidatus Roizmanbacteria bacterium CG10_big_fil_rev_8_21_14_0_10_39_12]